METAARKQHIEQIVEGMHAIKRKLITCAGKSSASQDTPVITHSQWAVLGVIARKEHVGIKDVAKTLSISSSAATQLVEELVKNGYVLRKGDEQDRRALLLTLSPTYKTHMRQMHKKRMAQFMDIFDILTDTELAQYAKLNKKISENILAS